MKLTNKNYYTPQANLEYFSVSQYKSFLDCEAKALAEIDGKYNRPDTKALMMGSYVDAYFAGELVKFEAAHPEIINSRTGELKADYKACSSYIRRAERDPMFIEYLDGEKQTILTGELFGQPWKIKVDVLHDDMIVDLKLMRDMKPIFVDGEKKTFIDAWGYDLQAYVYQQIVYQNKGKLLPFYFAIITKEEHPDLAIIEMPQWKLNSVEPLMAYHMERFASVKALELPPERCGICDYCKDTKVLTQVTSYEELLNI